MKIVTSPKTAMKTPIQTTLLLSLLGSFTLPQAAPGQGTLFNYQGRLTDNSAPANGLYDLKFTIYDAASGGTSLAISVTNAGVSVSNGLFSVALDFGPGIFNGADR